MGLKVNPVVRNTAGDEISITTNASGQYQVKDSFTALTKQIESPTQASATIINTPDDSGALTVTESGTYRIIILCRISMSASAGTVKVMHNTTALETLSAIPTSDVIEKTFVQYADLTASDTIFLRNEFTSGSGALTSDEIKIVIEKISGLSGSAIDARQPYTIVGFDDDVDYKCDGTADDVQIQAAIDAVSAAGGGYIHLKGGDFDISATLTLKNNVYLAGEGAQATKLQQSFTGSLFENTSSPTRIYRCGVSNMMLTRASIAGSTNGIDLTDVSFFESYNIEITNFNNAIYANGHPYYSNFYNCNISACNTALSIHNASNEIHFFGGSWKNMNSYVIYANNCNQICFYGVAFEGADQVFNFISSSRQFIFSGCRFEHTGTSTFTMDSSTYGIDIIGGLITGLTITDNGTGNNRILSDEIIALNNRRNATKTVRIVGHGSGKTDSTPTLELEETYVSSGSPTNLKIKNPRGGGAFISGERAGTEYFKVSALDGAIEKGYVKPESGSGAPSSTPDYLGKIYIDTTAGNVYIAKGTASSADWVQVNN